MTASTSGDSMRSSADAKVFAPGTRDGGVLCTFGIDISDSANLGSGNCSRNRLDVIGSHDSRADNSNAKPMVFCHISSRYRFCEPDWSAHICLTSSTSAATGRTGVARLA